MNEMDELLSLSVVERMAGMLHEPSAEERRWLESKEAELRENRR